LAEAAFDDILVGDPIRIMAQVCEICGKKPQFGNNVSHAHNITRRRWNVNLQVVRAKINSSTRRIRVCTRCIRTGKVTKG
jgi:large subunit ribosomal protein L28